MVRADTADFVRPDAKLILRLLFRALPLFLAVLLYGYTVNLPFFLDDGPNFWLVENVQGLEMWAGSYAFPYYRPAVFSLWKLSALVMGRHDPALLHLVSVLSFGVIGIVTGLITRRLTSPPRNELAGGLAGVLFVFFPFSYQALALVSAQFHIMLVMGMVLSVWFALLWWQRRAGWIVLLFCWLSAFLGIFSHENGVLLIPLILGLALLVYRRARLSLRRVAPVIVPVGVIVAVYTLLWFTVPRADSGNSIGLSTAPDQASAYLFQGIIYPFAAVLRPLIEGDLAPLPLLALAVCIALPALVWIWYRSREAGYVAAYGLVWYALGVLLLALLLAPAYVLDSPRLMLLASVGGSLFWGSVLAFVLRETRRSWLLGAGIVVLFVGVSVNFVGWRRYDYDRMGAYTWGLIRLLPQPRIGQPKLLIVNAPNAIHPNESDRTFLTGSEGVGFMTNELYYSQQLWLNTGIGFLDVDAIAHRQTLRHTDDIYVPHYPFVEGPELLEMLRGAAGIYATHFEDGVFWPVYVGGAGLAGPDGPIGTFPEIDLRLTQAEARLSIDHDMLTVQMRWQVMTPGGVKRFIHAFCDSELVGQIDGYPWADLYPFASWEPGETQTDIQQLRLSRRVEPGCLHIYTGAYWEADVARLVAINPNTGENYVNDLIPVMLKLDNISSG